MPKKPRTERKKIKRAIKESMIPSLEKTVEQMAEYTIFYAGESDSANELSAKWEMLANAQLEIIKAIEELILPHV